MSKESLLCMNHNTAQATPDELWCILIQSEECIFLDVDQDLSTTKRMPIWNRWDQLHNWQLIWRYLIFSDTCTTSTCHEHKAQMFFDIQNQVSGLMASMTSQRWNARWFQAQNVHVRSHECWLHTQELYLMIGNDVSIVGMQHIVSLATQSHLYKLLNCPLVPQHVLGHCSVLFYVQPKYVRLTCALCVFCDTQ